MRGNREQGVGNSVQKIKKLAAFGAMAATLVLAGCRQDMQDQPKFFPQRGTDFYADGRSVRPQVENTVARGQLRENAYFYTGLINGKEGEGMPFPATLEVLERGQERYNVYCTPCHSRVGNGVGMIVQRGYMKAGNSIPCDLRLLRWATSSMSSRTATVRCRIMRRRSCRL